MPYLYADSEPFPYDYNFLDTLRAFLECGATALEAVAAIEALERKVADQTMETGKINGALDKLGDSLDSSIEVAVARNPLPDLAGEVGGHVREYVERSIEQAKGRSDDELERIRSSFQGEVDAHKKTIKEAIEGFLLGAHVDVIESRYRIRLEDGGYDMFAVCELPRGLGVSYRLDAARLPGWQTPRKVGDLVGEMDIQVGMKKKFLSRDLTREIQPVGDFIISEVDLDVDHAEIKLKRKPDAPTESIVLAMTRAEDALGTEIRRPAEKAGGPDSIFPAVPDDLKKLRSLWRSLEKAGEDTLSQRSSVSSVTLDDHDLLDGNRVVEFVERYVELYQPVVAEIAKRSPSPNELSLKLEKPDGRREEVYLRRDDLVHVVESLDDEQMKIFTPLDFFPEFEIDVD